MIGKALVYSGFCIAIATIVLYLLATFKDKKFEKFGSWCYSFLTINVVAIVLYLLSLILSHRFDFTYVWEYSSKELPNNLLVATLYAGQQGSFLLWTFWLSIIGFISIPYLRKRGYEGPTMIAYTAIIGFLLFILIAKTPFEMVWESFPGQVNFGFVPQNGKGLNPVLQNYWITIHPPILFLGFASLAIPFAVAIGGFLKNDFRGWVKVATPWALWASGILGLGLMLGGLWAYETLGWGGFWAWDPVENSSLLPWLASAAFVHSALISRKNGSLIKTNFVLAILGFILVLYSSFLTRSGVLGDTSVHSFVSPGPIIYKLLLILLCLFIVIGIATLFIKLRAIPTQKTNQVLNSKEFLINIGSIILLCIAFIVFLGTSWPIIAEITGKQKASVEASWYNLLNLPLAVIMLLTNAYSIYARWGKSENSALIKQTINYIGISILLTLVTYFFGVKDFKFIVLAFSTYLALITNSEFIISSIRNNPKATGAYLSHFGIALLILGAMATGGYSEKKQIRLEEGKSSKFLDYSIKFSSKEQIDKQWQDREKYKYTFEIDKNGSKGTVHPIVYWSDFNERKAPFFEPGIKAGFMQDLYISPYSIEYTYDYPPSILQKENKAKISVDSNYQIQLLKFEMSGARNGGEDGALKVGAVVRFSGLNNFIKEDTVYAFLDPKSGLNVPIWKQVGNSEIEVGFIQLIPDKQDLSKSKAVFAYKQKGKDLLPPKEIFVFEASTKPFIALVWIGTIFLVVGFIYSIFKYRQDFVTLAKDNSPSNDNQLVDAENSSSNVDIQENEK